MLFFSQDAYNLRRLQRTKDPKVTCVYSAAGALRTSTYSWLERKVQKKRDWWNVTSVGWQLGVRMTSESTSIPTCMTSVTVVRSVSKRTNAEQTFLDTWGLHINPWILIKNHYSLQFVCVTSLSFYVILFVVLLLLYFSKWF
jgi:fumarate reductase subunit C